MFGEMEGRSMGHVAIRPNFIAMYTAYAIRLPLWVRFVELGIIVLAVLGGVVLAFVLSRPRRQ
jgi:hypothetical protein